MLRCAALDQHDAGDRFESGNQRGPLGRRNQGPAGPLQLLDRRVIVEAYHQDVAETACRLQPVQMADVKEVEAAVRPYDHLPLPAPPFSFDHQLVQGDGFVPPRHRRRARSGRSEKMESRLSHMAWARARWHSCMCPTLVEGTAIGTSTRHDNALSPGPVKPMVVRPDRRAVLAPAITLGEVPLVLMAMAMSPGLPRPSIWREKTESKP